MQIHVMTWTQSPFNETQPSNFQVAFNKLKLYIYYRYTSSLDSETQVGIEMK